MKTIIIDIGHASGTGARGNGLEEHAVNCKIAKILSQKLFAHGLDAYMLDFPDNNNRDDLTKTVATANKVDAVLRNIAPQRRFRQSASQGRSCVLLLEHREKDCRVYSQIPLRTLAGQG